MTRNHDHGEHDDTSAGQADPDEARFSADFWDERYRAADMLWSGDPNPQLVAAAAGLTPGTALDVGSGEGADAIWLASRGWRVRGIDVSTVALSRAAARAAEAGPQVADRITWQQADVRFWEPAAGHFDLVSAQFMHLPGPIRESLHQRWAAAVGPGGTLLIVGHHPSDLQTSVRRPSRADLLFTADEIAATLSPAEWTVILAGAPARQALDPDGRTVTVHDAVLQATRR